MARSHSAPTDRSGSATRCAACCRPARSRCCSTSSGVAYIDSAGLGELVNAYTTVKKQGGALKLVGVTKKLKDLLVITKLSTVFDSFDTEAAALDELRGLSDAEPRGR